MSTRTEDLELLKIQHSEWDKLLKKEEMRPFPDLRLLQDYKKHKLKIKEKIEKTEKELFKRA